MQHAALCKREVQAAPRTRKGHVHQATLFFFAVRFGQAVFVRKQAFLESADEYAVKLQPFRRVHSHQLQCIGTGLRLIVARFQGGMREKSGEAGVFLILARDETRRGVDQLIKVLQTIGAFPFVLVIFLEPAVLDHVLDNLGQRQAFANRAHAGNEGDEGIQPLLGRAGFLADVFFQRFLFGCGPQTDATLARQIL